MAICPLMGNLNGIALTILGIYVNISVQKIYDILKSIRVLHSKRY